jgi:hypothetical protein
MGPFDNNTEQYIEDEAILDAHWLLHIASGQLCIIPRANDDFEGFGANDAVLETLYTLDDAQLSDAGALKKLGFEKVPDVLRRFSDDIGYYSV